MHVARYYFGLGAYVAAANRAQIALADYPGVPALQEALEILAKSYEALGMIALRDDTQRILEKNYPQAAAIKAQQLAKDSPWWKLW